MLKKAIVVLGFSLSLVAQAEMTANADCLANVRSKAKSDAESSLAPVRGLAIGKIAKLGNIAGKAFSLSLEQDESHTFPDKVQIRVKDGFSEIISSSAPDQDGVAFVSTAVKSSITGKIVSVSCVVTMKTN